VVDVPPVATKHKQILIFEIFFGDGDPWLEVNGQTMTGGESVDVIRRRAA